MILSMTFIVLDLRPEEGENVTSPGNRDDEVDKESAEGLLYQHLHQQLDFIKEYSGRALLQAGEASEPRDTGENLEEVLTEC